MHFGFEKQLKSVSGAADSVKRFDDDDDDDDDDDSNEQAIHTDLIAMKQGHKKNAFNAKNFLQTDSGCPIFFLVGWETLDSAIIKSSYEHAII